MLKKKLTIRGAKVHDVTYRFFLYDEASRLALSHFDARNIRGKTPIVEIYVGGDAGKIEQLVRFAKSNFPPLAEVADVTVDDYDGEIRTIDAFERSFMLEQQGKFASYGLGMLTTLNRMDKKQDEHVELTREISNKQDEHIEITRDGFADVSEKLDTMTRAEIEIKKLREEFMEIKQALRKAGIIV